MTAPSYTFNLDHSGLNHILASTGGDVARTLTRIGNQVVSGAKMRANVDTGLMRSRIEFRLDTEGGELVGIVAARTNYAYWVHEGHGSYGGNPFLTDSLREALA